MAAMNSAATSNGPNQRSDYEIVPLVTRSGVTRLDVLPFVVIYLCLSIISTVLTDKKSDSYSWTLLLFTYGLTLVCHIGLFLVSQWRVKVRAKVGYRSCPEDVAACTHCLVLDESSDDGGEIVSVLFEKHPSKAKTRAATICYQEIMFRCRLDIENHSSVLMKFEKINFPLRQELRTYICSKGHETKSSLLDSRWEYGTNQHNIPAPTFVDCLLPQLVAPFFLFQVFCVMLWSLDEYWYYAIFTLMMLCLFECTVALQRLKSLDRLRDALRPPYYLLVFREKRWVPVLSNSLVVGDIISITTRRLQGIGGAHDDSHHQVPCDLLMIRGSAVVNEAMLTGESVPQLKDAADLSQYAKEVVLDIDDPPFRRHIVYGGTHCLDQSIDDPATVVSCDDHVTVLNGINTPPDRGCVCIVLRTGFGSQQGQLLRTLIYNGNKNNGVNNFDNFVYICILLLCALFAASTVINATWEDETRNKFKVILHVIIILTSVVPPELPMELSLAVTSSLAALVQFGIYCTEPFRIPLAGEVDTCCFDKTGTLTSDEMCLRGLRCVGDGMSLTCKDGSQAGSNNDLINPTTHGVEVRNVTCDNVPKASNGKVPVESLRVLVGCQGLSLGSDGAWIGDPLELAVVKDANWTIRNNNVVEPPIELALTGVAPVEVLYRFAFESKLKRMIVIARDEKKEGFYSLMKGAPEVLKPLLKNTTVPSNYDKVYRYHMAKGQRVLCLAYKALGTKGFVTDIRKHGREYFERDMTFSGFAVMDCPLKPDSFSIINQLKSSSHRPVMITGDSALTAAEVARQVGIIDTEPGHTFDLRELKRTLPDGSVESAFAFVPLQAQAGEYNAEDCIAFVANNVEALSEMVLKSQISLCLTGDILMKIGTTAASLSNDENAIDPSRILLNTAARKMFKILVPLISVFARHSPRQKEAVIKALNDAGHITLMCGDGTNDVGALKEAHVGISIVSAPDIEARVRSIKKKGKKKAKHKKSSLRELAQVQDELAQVSLGDASMASPFTSRTMSIKCCKDILLRGRCTLVTMLQIYKILGVNSLINALVLTNLHLHGVKQGDRQLTALGLVVAAMFLFVTKGKPLNSLSSKRPPSSVLCLQALVSISIQFLVHFIAITTVATMTLPFIDPDNPSMTPDGPFNPNPLNTACFLILVGSTISTFVINCRGHPFMQTFKQNKLLLRSVQVSVLVLFVCVSEVFEPLNQILQLAPLPDSVVTADHQSMGTLLSRMLSSFGYKMTLWLIIMFDALFAYVSEQLVIKYFG